MWVSELVRDQKTFDSLYRALERECPTAELSVKIKMNNKTYEVVPVIKFKNVADETWIYYTSKSCRFFNSKIL